MKVLLIFGLVLGLLAGITSHTEGARENETRARRVQNVEGLVLSINTHKRRYKRTDQIKFDVMLTNSGKEAVYILGALDFGPSASLLLHVRDAAGKEIQPFFDDQTLTAPDDKSAFVKLLPDHFLGTNFFSPANVLNMNRPGRYSIYVEYQSPFSATDVPLTPFWGKENGELKSNVLNFEIVR